MHDSVMDYGRRMLTDAVVYAADVLEVGSLDVNGSLRSHVMRLRPNSYRGVDIRHGPGVEFVLDAADLPPDMADVIVCTEMLEHAANWKDAMVGMTRALRSHGYLLLTTRGPGAGRHDHPGDHWRFTTDHMAESFGVLGLECLSVEADPEIPGVLAFGRKVIPRWGELPDAVALDDIEPLV